MSYFGPGVSVRKSMACIEMLPRKRSFIQRRSALSVLGKAAARSPPVSISTVDASAPQRRFQCLARRVPMACKGGATRLDSWCAPATFRTFSFRGSPMKAPGGEGGMLRSIPLFFGRHELPAPGRPVRALMKRRYISMETRKTYHLDTASRTSKVFCDFTRSCSKNRPIVRHISALTSMSLPSRPFFFSRKLVNALSK
jgi:hypothetical protein